jgi:hypothetical protein
MFLRKLFERIQDEQTGRLILHASPILALIKVFSVINKKLICISIFWEVYNIHSTASQMRWIAYQSIYVFPNRQYATGLRACPDYKVFNFKIRYMGSYIEERSYAPGAGLA